MRNGWSRYRINWVILLALLLVLPMFRRFSGYLTTFCTSVSHNNIDLFKLCGASIAAIWQHWLSVMFDIILLWLIIFSFGRLVFDLLTVNWRPFKLMIRINGEDQTSGSATTKQKEEEPLSHESNKHCILHIDSCHICVFSLCYIQILV